MKVLQLIRTEGPVSRAEIARRLDLSRPTASRIIDDLMQEGIVSCVGKSQPTGGRPGDLYAFRLEAGVVLGLQLGTRDARAAVATLGGEILCRTTQRLSLSSRQRVLSQLRGFVTRTLQELPHRPVTIVSVGVAVPGVVDLASGTVRHAASVFPGLNDRPLMRELEQLFGAQVVLENDVNLAALGEWHSGCAQGSDTVAYLFVGSGVGAGLILNGQLLRGSAGAAGEIGYMVVDRANLTRSFGALGCLEHVAGIHRIVAAAKERGLPWQTPDTVCEQAFAGHPHAMEIIAELVEYLAAAMINIVTLIDPELVVLGGDLADLPHADALFVRPIETLMRRHVISAPQVRLSELQGEAALYGAVHVAVGHALASAGLGAGHAAAALTRSALATPPWQPVPAHDAAPLPAEV
jgi:predicted NBD/HSP70 family sugar kinase